MNCDFVQERLSAFLDREESTDDIEAVLSHLYGCEKCQRFFNAAAKLRTLASEDNKFYPLELDNAILRKAPAKQKTNLFGYRLKLPAYVASAVALILAVVSFMFGFMLQENTHQKEIRTILQAPPSQVVYGMSGVTVYPVMNHQTQGGGQ